MGFVFGKNQHTLDGFDGFFMNVDPFCEWCDLEGLRSGHLDVRKGDTVNRRGLCDMCLGVIFLLASG